MLISWAAAPTRASNTLANTTAILHNDDGDDGDGDYDDDGYNDDGGGRGGHAGALRLSPSFATSVPS